MSLKLIEKRRSFGGEQCKYTHYSEVLQCEMTFSIYLPSNKEKKKIPLIWWLSGLTCTDDNFSQKSGFQRLAEKYQVAVMIPDTSPRGEHVADDEGWDLGKGAGFYVNATQDPWAKHYQDVYVYRGRISSYCVNIGPSFFRRRKHNGPLNGWSWCFSDWHEKCDKIQSNFCLFSDFKP